MKETYYDKKIIIKPWGKEYIIFRDKKKISITFLKINFNQSTSLHCHPEKKTGFIILNGKMKVQIGLYKKNSRNFLPLSNLVIRPGLFHSLKSISKKGTIALEVESPAKKNNLLRFKDYYGRANTPYEKKNFIELEKKDTVFSKPKKNNSNFYLFGKIKITIKFVKNLNDLKRIKKNSTCAILDGEIITKNRMSVLKYGEIIKLDTIKEFLKYYRVKDKLLVLVASKL